MNTQPEALMHAKWLETKAAVNSRNQAIATELRRLYEVNQTLLAACIEATSLFDNYPQCFEAIGTYQVLDQAIFKATEESK